MAKILIIDDDEDTTRLMELVLLGEGHETVTINDSHNAIHKVVASQADLILLDLMMPNMNGYQLCELICNHPKLASIPVIVFSALGDNKSKEMAFKAGAKDYLTKPVYSQDFKLRIKTILQKSR